MNFRPELADLVIAGRKTVTRRLTRSNPNSPWWEGGCRYKPGGGPGGSYAVCPGRGKPARGRIRVEAVDLVRLGLLLDSEARDEGFEDARAFAAAWREINGAYLPDVLVWRVEFVVVGREVTA